MAATGVAPRLQRHLHTRCRQFTLVFLPVKNWTKLSPEHRYQRVFWRGQVKTAQPKFEDQLGGYTLFVMSILSLGPKREELCKLFNWVKCYQKENWERISPWKRPRVTARGWSNFLRQSCGKLGIHVPDVKANFGRTFKIAKLVIEKQPKGFRKSMNVEVSVDIMLVLAFDISASMLRIRTVDA